MFSSITIWIIDVSEVNDWYDDLFNFKFYSTALALKAFSESVKKFKFEDDRM